MTVGDVIAAAKATPGELQYGTIGLDGSSHINMVLFDSRAGVKLTPDFDIAARSGVCEGAARTIHRAVTDRGP
jgi:hypothetical protein